MEKADMKKISGAAAAVLIVATLAACGFIPEAEKAKSEESAPQETLPKTGDCYGDEVQVQIGHTPDLTTKVACSKQHLFEVTGVVKVPSKYLQNDSQDWERLGDNESEPATPFSRWMDRTCSKSILELSGLKGLTVNGMPGADALAEPVVASAYTEWSVTTQKQWDHGHRLAFCVLHFDESEDLEGGDDDSVRSPTSEPLVKRYLDPKLPPKSRYCWNYGVEITRVPCSKVHDAESVFNYNVDEVLGKRFANRIDINVEELPEAQYQALLRPCIAALPRVLGPIDGALVAEVVYGDWQWEWGRHIATCAVGTYEGQQLPGRSLFGNARKVKLPTEEENRGT